MSSSTKDTIANIVDNIFDNIGLELIGNIPRLRNKKLSIISMEPHFGLSNLFVQSMQNKIPNELEKDLLKGLLNSSDGYIEALKNKTRANVIEKIDGLIREKKIKKEKPTDDQIKLIIKEEMDKAKADMSNIVEAESSKFRNMGTMLSIGRMASSAGDDDPTIFFAVVKDNVTCKECIRLHLMPDKITPRLWKFSELKQGYHKRGENNPSAFGLHPNCRCQICYLSRGFSFDKKGKVIYHSDNYNAYESQNNFLE